METELYNASYTNKWYEDEPPLTSCSEGELKKITETLIHETGFTDQGSDRRLTEYTAYCCFIRYFELIVILVARLYSHRTQAARGSIKVRYAGKLQAHIQQAKNI